MHPLKQEFDLPRLRRQLEELLVMVKADHNGAVLNRGAAEKAVLCVQHEIDPTATLPGIALTDNHPEPETRDEPALSEPGQPDNRDPFYDDALVIITEFGAASPGILQMWLKIDYGRATKILSQLQADDLVSSKGRVRHKAYSLRRSEQDVTNPTSRLL